MTIATAGSPGGIISVMRSRQRLREAAVRRMDGGETGMEVCANFECTRLSKGWFIVG